MITRYSVWLDGKGLQDIAESIYITDIREQAPKLRASTSDRLDGRGTRLMRMDRQSLSVSIRFAIRAYNTQERRELCGRARAWAHDGHLSTSDRPGQRLYVVCDKLPTVDSALRWTDELEMTLTAYDCPWWEAETPTTARCTSRPASVALMSVGDAWSPLDATVTASEPVNVMTIQVDGKTMQLSGLGMHAGDTLRIAHDHRGLLQIKIGEQSALAKRTAESVDDLMIKPGANSVLFDADGACTALFSTRGRFL